MKNEDLYHEENRQTILDMEQTIEACNVVQYIDALKANYKFYEKIGNEDEFKKALMFYKEEVSKYRELYLDEKYPDVETNPNGYARTILGDKRENK